MEGDQQGAAASHAVIDEHQLSVHQEGAVRRATQSSMNLEPVEEYIVTSGPVRAVAVGRGRGRVRPVVGLAVRAVGVVESRAATEEKESGNNLNCDRWGYAGEVCAVGPGKFCDPMIQDDMAWLDNVSLVGSEV